MNDKYKNKIRKLLSLAQSDNPHEAQRAKHQAEQLMKKHNIQAGDIEVLTVKAQVAVKRKGLKLSENTLLACICHISGCHSFISTKGELKGESYQYESVPEFMGLKHDAELAAYTWDVLYKQLLTAQAEARREYRWNAAEIEKFSEGWATSAGRKVITVFQYKPAPEKVSSAYEREAADIPKAKVAKPKSTGSKLDDQLLLANGKEIGNSAVLNNAAPDFTASRKNIAAGAIA